MTESFEKDYYGMLSLPAFLVTDHERLYTLSFWAKVRVRVIGEQCGAGAARVALISGVQVWCRVLGRGNVDRSPLPLPTRCSQLVSARRSLLSADHLLLTPHPSPGDGQHRRRRQATASRDLSGAGLQLEHSWECRTQHSALSFSALGTPHRQPTACDH